MTAPTYDRGDVVDGPNQFGPGDRPYICLTDTGHPFNNEEAVWVVVSKTPRSVAIELTSSEFAKGGLRIDPSYANPWNLVTIKNADMGSFQGVLTDDVIEEIQRQAAAYIIPQEFPGRP